MSDKVVGLEPVMSMFATEVECLRARDKWNEAQVAALQAELAEANDSLTVAYMAGAASKLDEILALQAELAECKRDARNSALNAAIADELERVAEVLGTSYESIQIRNRANELRNKP